MSRPLLGLCLAVIWTVASPPAHGQKPAADGTISVVVPTETPPPAAPAAAPPQQLATGPAAELLAASLEPLEKNRGGDPLLYARPLPLLEALERSGDRTRRLWITQAYWKVSAAFAAVRFATESVERLQLIAPGGDPHDAAALDVAVAAAQADLAEARADLVAAQQELVDLVRLPAGEALPWPVDRPLATPYQTHFDAIFASRPAPGRIRAIDRMLPSRHEAIEVRAAAVVAARKAVAMAEADHAKAKRPIEAVIVAEQAVRLQESKFLAATRGYNLDIAEYAMSVADPAMPDDRFVSMLIGTPIQWRGTAAVAPVGGIVPESQPPR
jgi:hypothetical protein